MDIPSIFTCNCRTVEEFVPAMQHALIPTMKKLGLVFESTGTTRLSSGVSVLWAGSMHSLLPHGTGSEKGEFSVQPKMTSAPSPQTAVSVLFIQNSAQTLWLVISVSVDHWRSTSKEKTSDMMRWKLKFTSPSSCNYTCGVLLGHIPHLVWQLHGETRCLPIIRCCFGCLCRSINMVVTYPWMLLSSPCACRWKSLHLWKSVCCYQYKVFFATLSQRLVLWYELNWNWQFIWAFQT